MVPWWMVFMILAYLLDLLWRTFRPNFRFTCVHYIHSNCFCHFMALYVNSWSFPIIFLAMVVILDSLFLFLAPRWPHSENTFSFYVCVFLLRLYRVNPASWFDASAALCLLLGSFDAAAQVRAHHCEEERERHCPAHVEGPRPPQEILSAPLVLRVDTASVLPVRSRWLSRCIPTGYL